MKLYPNRLKFYRDTKQIRNFETKLFWLWKLMTSSSFFNKMNFLNFRWRHLFQKNFISDERFYIVTSFCKIWYNLDKNSTRYRDFNEKRRHFCGKSDKNPSNQKMRDADPFHPKFWEKNYCNAFLIRLSLRKVLGQFQFKLKMLLFLIRQNFVIFWKLNYDVIMEEIKNGPGTMIIAFLSSNRIIKWIFHFLAAMTCKILR